MTSNDLLLIDVDIYWCWSTCWLMLVDLNSLTWFYLNYVLLILVSCSLMLVDVGWFWFNCIWLWWFVFDVALILFDLGWFWLDVIIFWMICVRLYMMLVAVCLISFLILAWLYLSLVYVVWLYFMLVDFGLIVHDFGWFYVWCWLMLFVCYLIFSNLD